MSAVAIGEQGFRAIDIGEPPCGQEHRFGVCKRAGCVSDHDMSCTAPSGHLVGDLPHLAHALEMGIVGIWDEAGRDLLGCDYDGEGLTNVGATL